MPDYWQWEQQQAAQLSYESSRLSLREGRAVDHHGFAKRHQEPPKDLDSIVDWWSDEIEREE